MELTLKAARVNKNLTQRQAAKLLGVSEYTLFNYEKGKTFPSCKETLDKIQEIYEIKYDDLIFLPKNNGLTVNKVR